MKKIFAAFKTIYRPDELWTLFLVIATPLHIWTFIQWFGDISWISARTNAWDAVAVGGYGLLSALLESFFAFVAALLLGFLVSKKWDSTRLRIFSEF